MLNLLYPNGKITLFRGVKEDFFTNWNITPPKDGEVVDVAINSAASWTNNYNTAFVFGDYVLTADIDINDIFSSYITNKDFLPGEAEFIVMNGKIKVINVRKK